MLLLKSILHWWQGAFLVQKIKYGIYRALFANNPQICPFIMQKTKGEMKNMTQIDWKRKLTSRKLWTAITSFVSMMIIFCGGAENTATQVSALIMAGATVIAYIIAEGLTDVAHMDESTDAEEEQE